MINQDIVNLAKKLQKNAENTGNRFFAIEILDEFIEDYKWNEDNLKNYELLYILKYILESGFDISDFEICDIPLNTLYSFCNSDETKFFDICFFDDMESYELIPDIYPAYVKNINGILDEVRAETIKEAIEKFEIF